MKLTSRTILLSALLSITLVCALAVQSQINLSWQVTGVGPIANGMTGAATSAANTVLAGPIYGSALAPSFKGTALVYSPKVLGVPGPVRWGYIVSVGSVGAQDESKLGWVKETGTAPASAAATSTLPAYSWNSTAAIPAHSYSMIGDPWLLRGKNIKFMGMLRLLHGASERAFYGVTDQVGTTMTTLSDPAGNYAGFQRDTDTDNNKYRCISKDNVTQTAQDSGVSDIDDAFHKFMLLEDSATETWYWYIDGNQVCSDATHVPAAASLLGVTWQVQTFEAVAKEIDRAWMFAQADY